MGLVYTTVPDTLTISAETNTTVYFITSAITSLDSSSPLTDALDIFKSAIANEQNLLAEYHERRRGGEEKRKRKRKRKRVRREGVRGERYDIL